MSYELYVFGSNGEGQLGVPAADIISTPTRVVSPPCLQDLKLIKCGVNHTLFLSRSGNVVGAGDNRKFQLVTGNNVALRYETFRGLYNNVKIIAATCESSGYVFEELSVQNSIHTEGFGQWGELGRGEGSFSTSRDEDERIVPKTRFQTAVVDFSAGLWHYVAILQDGSVHGWGKARLGQLGKDLTGKVTTPTEIMNIPFRPFKVVCGKDFTYLAGHTNTGDHVVLGQDKFNIDSSKPKDIRGWKDIGASWHAIFVLFEDGTLHAWGKENMWQLIPPDLPLIKEIAVGSDHVLAVTWEGDLISWGWGKHGNCGDLSKIKDDIQNDMVSGFWNVINLPGSIEKIAAGSCTSFVVTKQA